MQNSHNAPKKKGNKRPYWLVKNTPHFRLWFEREHLIQLTDNYEWKAQNLRGKGRKSKPNELVSLKIVLKVRDPKLARVLIVQNNVYASVHGAIGEDRLRRTCKNILTSSCLRMAQ